MTCLKKLLVLRNDHISYIGMESGLLTVDCVFKWTVIMEKDNEFVIVKL
jgi:hypothetical protein